MSKKQPKQKTNDLKDIKNPDMVESVTWQEIEYTCPVRGKVKQMVRVIKYKPAKPPENSVIKTGNPLIDDISISDLITEEDGEELE